MTNDMMTRRVFGSTSVSEKHLFNVSDCAAIRERVVLRGAECSTDRCGQLLNLVSPDRVALAFVFYSPSCHRLGSSSAAVSTQILVAPTWPVEVGHFLFETTVFDSFS